MIWAVVWMNGVATGMTITAVRLRPILPVLIVGGRSACTVAVAGAATRGTAACRAVYTSARRTATISSASASPSELKILNIMKGVMNVSLRKKRNFNPERILNVASHSKTRHRECGNKRVLWVSLICLKAKPFFIPQKSLPQNPPTEIRILYR